MFMKFNAKFSFYFCVVLCAAIIFFTSVLTAAEETRLKNLKGSEIPMPLDSARVLTVNEMEEGVLRKRLYVANGNGAALVSSLLVPSVGLEVASELPVVSPGLTKSAVTNSNSNWESKDPSASNS